MTQQATVHATPPIEPWQPRWLLAAPHRLAFFAGAVVLGLSAAWWLLALLMPASGAALPWAVSRPLAHSLVMGYGFLPLFMAGFLFTAGPRWLQVPAPDAEALLKPIAATVAGWCVFLLGVHTHAWLAAASLLVCAAGWGRLAHRFVRLFRASAVPDRVHARIVMLACVAITFLLAIAAIGVATGVEAIARAAVQAGLWGCVAVIYAVVAHRMIPFFTANALPAVVDAWKPLSLLAMMVAGLLFEALFAAAEAAWWPLPAGVRWAQATIELPFAALLIWLAWRWGVVQSLKVRLLAMLHLGFLWLGIAYALLAASHMLMVASNGELSLGLAPTHALTMGFFGSTLIAMATRVACGHSGRALVADDIAWGLFWLVQAAVCARILAALWPAVSSAALPVAAGAWAAAMVGWALRYGRWFGRPRADGRPG